MNYNKEIIYINKEDRSFLERKIQLLEEEKDALDKVIVRVKNMINPLSKEEKFVIKVYYMDKSKWDYVEKEYFKEFEKYKTAKNIGIKNPIIHRESNLLKLKYLPTSAIIAITKGMKKIDGLQKIHITETKKNL
jgi:ribosomal protein L11 methylase PrmA